MKRHWVVSAVGVALSTATVIACGETRNVLTGPPDAGAADAGVDAAISSRPRGDASADGGNVAVDPHAAERRQLADQYCNLHDKYPCFLTAQELDAPDGRAVPDTAACSQQTQLDEEMGVPEACWNDWVETMTCLINAPRHCPSNGLLLGPLVVDLDALDMSSCSNAALEACLAREAQEFMVTGSRFTCYGDTSPQKTACNITCTDPNADAGYEEFEGNCQGPPSGPFLCNISLNGQALFDDAIESFASFYSDDCASVARAMANGGAGVNDVDCCFVWETPADASAERNHHCSCTADPTQAGFATCAAAAAAGQGHVVDLCPQYVSKGSAGFPTL
jgi:hypothetical protein